MSRENKDGGEVPRGGAQAPQSPWGSATVMPEMTVREIEEAVRECVSGNCGRVRAIIDMARLGEYGMYMLVRAGIAALLERSLSRYRISRVMVTNGYVLKRLMGLNEVLEFRLVSDFRPKSVFDAYWMFTSLVTLRLPFIVRSRFDPINENVCGAFGDEKLCHMYIAGYLIAESAKSTEYPSRRFKQMGTTNPASIVTMLSIANHFAKHGIMTKVYINERQRWVYFILNDLPEDIERLIEDVLRDPTSIAELADKEFMALLSGVIAGDGTIVRGHGNVEVAIVGNLESEKPLYAVIRGELLRRFGVEASLYENELKSAIRLRTWDYDAVRLLRMLPPLIEPLKELRRQLLLNKDKLGAYLVGELFRLLGDGKNNGKKNGEKGVHGLQSYQAIRFLTVLTRLGLIRLRKVEGFKHHILETPTNPHGRAQTNKQKPRLVKCCEVRTYLGLIVHEDGSIWGMAYESGIREFLNSYGFLNLTLEIINPYGGAVITGISGNYARTGKSLTATVTYSSTVGIPGWLEQFRALTVVLNVTNRIGYYQYVILRLMRIGPS